MCKKISIFLKEWNEAKGNDEARKKIAQDLWFDWFCSTKSLYGRTKKIIKPLKTILAKCKDTETLEVSMKNNCPWSGPLYDCMRIFKGDEFAGCLCIIPSGLCIKPGQDEPYEIMDADGKSTFFDDKDKATDFLVECINSVETPQEKVNDLCEIEKANGDI